MTVRGDPKDPGMYVVLWIGQKRYAIPASAVKEVLFTRSSAGLPSAGPSVSGAFFFRGACVTILDLGWKLAGRPVSRTRSSRVIVLREPKWAALLVDGIAGVAGGCREKTAAAARPSGREGAYIGGWIDWTGETVPVIDIAKLIASERWAAAARPSTLESGGLDSEAAPAADASR